MATFASFSNAPSIVMLPEPDPAKIASLVPGSPVVISSSWRGLQVGPMPENLLPFGSTYWALMAPHMTVDLTGKKSGGSGSAKGKKTPALHEFPDELIKVPTNVKPKNLHKFNFYDLLGVGEHADSADEGAIRKGYHKCVLLYHPDKRQDKTASGAEDNSVWLKIQEAFATLLDINKRRAYDSQLPFDESTPTERDLDASLEADPENGFYTTFDSVFKRNGRFAESKPVPELGNASTAIETVEAFYSYWIKFDSWRDFTGKGAEYRPDEATSREEKRFMMKENEKLAVKLKKKEIARVTDMVMLAMKRDPRLLAHKQAQKDAKEAERLAKETAALNLAATMAQKEAEEKELAARAKVDKDQMRKKASNARNFFRRLLRAIVEETREEGGEYGSISSEDLDKMLARSEVEDILGMVEKMGGEGALKDKGLLQITGAVSAKEAVQQMHEDIASGRADATGKLKVSIEAVAGGAAASASSAESEGASARVWSRDELSALAKAVSKYPAGLGQRWQAISNSMNDLLKPKIPFTMDECMKVSNDVKKSAAAGKLSPQVAAEGVKNDWSQQQQQLLEEGLKKYPSSLAPTERWDKIAGMVTGKTKKDCIERYKFLCEVAKQKK